MNHQRRNLLGTALGTWSALAWPLTGTAAVPSAALPAIASLSLPDFLALSARLCACAVPQLDEGFASRLLQRLQTLALPDSAVPSAIVQAWYTGNLPAWVSARHATTDEPVDFAQALLWSCVPGLHLPATCGGAYGHWAQPPEHATQPSSAPASASGA